MADNKFDTTVSSLFKGMDGFLSAKTVVGEPVTVMIQLYCRLLMFRSVWLQVLEIMITRIKRPAEWAAK